MPNKACCPYANFFNTHLKMQLPEFIGSLETENQIQLAIEMIEIGLPVWENYNSGNPIEYTDSVVGMHHKIDSCLIEKAISLLKKMSSEQNGFAAKGVDKLKLESLRKDVNELIVAIADGDVELPLQVQLIVYATSNLIDCVLGKAYDSSNKNLAYISIEQSIDAIARSKILNSDKINEILERAKKASGNSV